MRKKSVSFLMPGGAGSPSGGYKVIFEQANRLVQDGWDVFIVYPVICLIGRPSFRNVLGAGKRYLQGFAGNAYLPGWFPGDARVHHVKVISLVRKYVPATYFYCATSVETAYYLEQYQIHENRKFYYIQGYEDWNYPVRYAVRSYSFKMHKIVIADWLLDKVKETGNEAVLITNGFDFEKFYIEKAIDERDPFLVMMLYSDNDGIKRCSDAVKACYTARKRFPKLKVIMFGVPDRPKGLPEWFEYHQNPGLEELRGLYNRASIFIAASRTEGLALPPAEAMMCGCALVCTDIGGFKTYAADGYTALLSPVYDIEALSENMMYLMKNDSVRIQTARNGNRYIQQFTWDKSYRIFSNILTGAIENR